MLWRTAGANRLLRLVVIAALAYRPRKGGKLLYRQPAYLICTDPHLSVSELVQNYIWRWEIEVNFREEKTLIGVGQAQVRQAASTQAVPALLVAAYALLLLAAARCAESGSAPDVLPPPKWDTNKPPSRTSTQRMLHRLRSEIWGRGLDLHENSFSGFVTRQVATSKSEKLLPSLSSALLYCNA